MANTVLQVDGLDRIAGKFAKLDGEIEKKALVVIDKALQPIEMAMKTNVAAMFGNKGYGRGIMMKSIGRSSGRSKKFEGVGGQVGVFDMSSKTGNYGLVSGREITAPMLAQFYESGIRPHFTTPGTTLTRKDNSRQGRFSKRHDELVKRRESKGQAEMKMHPGSAPIPFLSQAWESSSPTMIENIERELDKMIQAAL